MVDCMAVCHLVLERVLFSNEDLKKGAPQRLTWKTVQCMR